MDDVLRALSAPRRRQILHLVRDAELSAGSIAAHFDVSRPAISEHLRVLRETGLVSERRQGVRRLYRARPEALSEVRRFLDDFWDDSLERLRLAAESEQRQQREHTHGAA
jgi:DNA-binding transcriptional ArsR family regulator